jgi:hypothetical protein
MKFHAPATAALVFSLAIATTSLAQDVATPTTEETTPVATTAPAATDTVENTEIPQAVLDVVGKPEAGKALIVFFRANRFAGAAIKFKVRENEVELGKLGSGNYILAQVEPGKHTYTVHSEAKDVTNIEVEAGETYFVVGTITMGFMAGHPNLTPSTAAAFQAEMKKMKLSN